MCMITVTLVALCGLVLLVLAARRARRRTELQARLNGLVVYDHESERPVCREGDHRAEQENSRRLTVAEIQARIDREAEWTRPIPRPYPRARQGRSA